MNYNYILIFQSFTYYFTPKHIKNIENYNRYISYIDGKI